MLFAANYNQSINALLSHAHTIRSQLHRKKLMFARDKLRPMSIQERMQRRDVENEQLAANIRNTEAAPNDVDAIFSYARNGRRTKLEDALARGFNIDAEDEFGNTLFIVAAQQVRVLRFSLVGVYLVCNIVSPVPYLSITTDLYIYPSFRSIWACVKCCLSVVPKSTARITSATPLCTTSWPMTRVETWVSF